MGFEPTIPASERAKTVHGLDRSATVTGRLIPFADANLQPNADYCLQQSAKFLKERTIIAF
jgi:hypothetical protein